MKIALIQCPMFNVRMPQLGPAYLKSILKKNKHEVCQFDFNIELYNKADESEKKYWNYVFQSKCSEGLGFLNDSILEEWAGRVLQSGADLVGFTIYETSSYASLLLARRIKKIDPTKCIIFGGPSISCYLDMNDINIGNIDAYTRSMFDTIDVMVAGEAEETIVEVVERLKSKDTLNGCLGVIAKEKGSLVVNKLRPLIRDLDSLPFPDFSIIDSRVFTEKDCLPILASRGCPNRCVFCDYPYLGRYKFRARGVENVVDEIKFLITKYGIKSFHFNDSTINADTNFLSKMCDRIIQEDISITWGASASISKNLDRPLLNTMKRSGCLYLSFGVESASTKVLRDMKKNFSVEDIQRNLIDCYDSGIEAMTNWIIGFPTETAECFKDTLDFIRKNKKYISGFDVAMFSIKKNTYIYENMDTYNIKLNKTYDWLSLDGANTYDERLKRLKAFWKNQIDKIHFERIGGSFNTESMASFLDELKHEHQSLKEQQRRDATIKDGPLEMFFDQGKARIFYNGKELTKQDGLNTHFFYDGKFIDSKNALWEIERQSDNKITAVAAWKGVPLEEIFEFELTKDSVISLNVRLKTCQKLDLNDLELAVALPKDYSGWFSLHETGLLEAAHGILLKDLSQKCIGLENSNNPGSPRIILSMPGNLPAFIPFINHEPESEKILFSLKGPYGIPEGESSLFNAKIFVSDKEDQLNSFMDELKHEYQAMKERQRRDATIKRGPLELFFDQGKARVFYNGKELTKGYGLYISYLSSAGWTDSLQVKWIINKVNGHKLIAEGVYAPISVSQVLEFELKEPLTLSFTINTDMRYSLGINVQDVNLMVSDRYKKWQTDDSEGDIKDDFKEGWQTVFGIGKKAATVLYGKNSIWGKQLPGVSFISAALFPCNEITAIHNTNNTLNARVLVNRKEFSEKTNVLKAGESCIIHGEIEIKNR